MCSTLGAAIMQRLETYPLLQPNAKRMSMKSTSELMIGIEVEVAERWTLHIKNRGIKSVLAKDSDTSRFADQIITRSNWQI